MSFVLLTEEAERTDAVDESHSEANKDVERSNAPYLGEMSE